MNRFIAITVLAGGLFTTGTAAQAAHDEPQFERPAAGHHQWRSYDRERYDRGSRHRRSKRRGHHDKRDHHDDFKYARRGHMPKWLRRQESFRHWYRHSSQRHDRYMSWYQLHELYRWEHSRRRHYRYYDY